MNFDGQLRASQLILSYTRVYSTWQPFRQALLVDSLLLSYIDMRHSNFLPPNLIVGEARDLDPRLVKAESLVPVRDASTNSIFQGCAVHRPVEELSATVLATQASRGRIDKLFRSRSQAGRRQHGDQMNHNNGEVYS